MRESRQPPPFFWGRSGPGLPGCPTGCRGGFFRVCVPRAGAPPFLTSPARLPVIRRHSGFQSVAGRNDGMTGKTGKT